MYINKIISKSIKGYRVKIAVTNNIVIYILLLNWKLMAWLEHIFLHQHIKDMHFNVLSILNYNTDSCKLYHKNNMICYMRTCFHMFIQYKPMNTEILDMYHSSM